MRLKYQRKQKGKTNRRCNATCCRRQTASKNAKKPACFDCTDCTFCKRSPKAYDWNVYPGFCKIGDIIKNANSLQKDTNQNKRHQNSSRSDVGCDDEQFAQHTNEPTYQKHPQII